MCTVICVPHNGEDSHSSKLINCCRLYEIWILKSMESFWRKGKKLLSSRRKNYKRNGRQRCYVRSSTSQSIVIFVSIYNTIMFFFIKT